MSPQLQGLVAHGGGDALILVAMVVRVLMSGNPPQSVVSRSARAAGLRLALDQELLTLLESPGATRHAEEQGRTVLSLAAL